MDNDRSTDVLIIGGGAAGLSAALELAGRTRVTVLTKTSMGECSSAWAQGGIAAVRETEDSEEVHVADTLRAGAGLCRQSAVEFAVSKGPAAAEWLIGLGVPFTRNDDNRDFHLTREGGHSHRRILHANDATGEAIFTTLDAKVRATDVELVENCILVDLITGRDGRCEGAYVLDRQSGHVVAWRARFVILATGGASKAYLYTTNPDTSTGDGIACAWRAGCRVSNMEFIQFHPTCLFHPEAKSFLITEALRGEGALLRLPDGERFMQRFDSRGELAPRDIVARAIDHEMKRLGCDCVYLDITHRSTAFIDQHFPMIRERCLGFGVDMTREPIPVVPAAHYTCGGVIVDTRGRTDVDGLYAVGETSSTGLHGANRLASNSLLECFVWAHAAAKDITTRLQDVPLPPRPVPWDESLVTNSDEDVVIAHNWDELRRFMWDYVGIVRTDRRLERAAHRIQLLRHEVDEYYGNYRVTSDLVELRNLIDVADLIVRSARERRESRGLHYTLDYPTRDRVARDTILVPENAALAPSVTPLRGPVFDPAGSGSAGPRAS